MGSESLAFFKAMSFGRTLVVSFQLLPFILGFLGYGRRNRDII